MTGEVDPVAALREACAVAGSQKAWARRHEVPQSTVSAILNRRMAVSRSVAIVLGLERVEGVVTYRRRQ